MYETKRKKNNYNYISLWVLKILFQTYLNLRILINNHIKIFLHLIKLN